MRRWIMVLAGIAALLTAGCTGSSSGGPSSPPPSPTSASAAPSAPPSAPASSVSCAQGRPARVTGYSRRPLLTHALQLSLAPDSSQRNALLPNIGTARAVVSDGVLDTNVLMSVENHFKAHVAAPGNRTDRHDLALRTLVRNRSKDNAVFVLYAGVQTYAARFTTTCAGTVTASRFTTFGHSRTGRLSCNSKPSSGFERLAVKLCR